MDPIATACASLLCTAGNLTKQISGFVRNVREARTDMDSIKRDLTSLSSVLELIEVDVKEHGQNILPVTLAKQIDGIVKNCEVVLNRISDALKGKGSMMDGVKWATGGKEKVLELRVSLESHKTSLELALELVQYNLARETNRNTHIIMGDTQDIRHVTGIIARDTSGIRVEIGAVLEELASLRVQVARQNESTKGEEDNVVLERYLNDLTSYAETVNSDVQDVVNADRTSLEVVGEVKGESSAVVDVNGDEAVEDVQVVSSHCFQCIPSPLFSQTYFFTLVNGRRQSKWANYKLKQLNSSILLSPLRFRTQSRTDRRPTV
jgi:hypothetical protein